MMKINNYKNFLVENYSEDIDFMMSQLNEYFTFGFEITLKSKNLSDNFKKTFQNFYFKYDKLISLQKDIESIKINTVKLFQKIDDAITYLKIFFNDFESQDVWEFSHNTTISIIIGIRPERRRTLSNGLYIPLNIVKGIFMISDQEKKEYSLKGMEIKLVDYCSSIKTKLIEKLKKEQNYELNSGDFEEMERYLHFKIKELYNFYTPKMFSMILKNSKQSDFLEFKYTGKENMKFEILKDKLKYFCYVVYLMNSEYREKEYHKKLSKFKEKVK